MTYVEIVVSGSFGDLATWAFRDLEIERQRLIRVSVDNVREVVDRLVESDVAVVTLRVPEMGTADAEESPVHPA